MGSRNGILKVSAKRIGISFDEYTTNVNSGFKYCWKCQQWKLAEMFGIDKSRYDGLNSSCQKCRRPKTGLPKLPSQQPFEKQARWAVNHAISAGRMTKPCNLPCFDCGKQAKEYDHHKGYKKENWFTVQAVCSSCHKKRTYSR